MTQDVFTKHQAREGLLRPCAVCAAHIPFVQSRAALALAFFPCLALLLGGYCAASQLVKHLYGRRWGEWL